MDEALKKGVAMNTREEWLNRVAKALEPKFQALGCILPPYRITCGFPSTGKKAGRIGECWARECSKDAHHEIFIHPKEDDSARVADILAHEMVHAAVGIQERHGKEFARVAKGLGLTGKMTSTVAGPEFTAFIEKVIMQIGGYPHGMLDTSHGVSTRKSKPRKGSLLKVECKDCGYIARVTAVWLDGPGAPICPCNNKPMERV
jgi:hypothetical protein